jgi:hypothetical protein
VQDHPSPETHPVTVESGEQVATTVVVVHPVAEAKRTRRSAKHPEAPMCFMSKYYRASLLVGGAIFL